MQFYLLINSEYYRTVSMTRDEIWIGNWIYWTPTLVTTYNYKGLDELHALKITVTTAHKVFSVITSHCLVVASNGRHFPSSGFLNCHWPQLTAFHFSQLQLSTDSTMDVPLLLVLAGWWPSHTNLLLF
jgi:hypothetical protein